VSLTHFPKQTPLQNPSTQGKPLRAPKFRRCSCAILPTLRASTRSRLTTSRSYHRSQAQVRAPLGLPRQGTADDLNPDGKRCIHFPPGNGLIPSDGAPAKPTGAVSGQFVTETFEYDGSRQVTVYVPPDPPEAIVFAGDGQGISKWGRLLEKADVPSTMIVGVHGLTDETLRLHEYSPSFEPERFAAHEKFFVEDVRRWTESRFGVALPTERTAVFGVSAGGELALALGLRHPHVYGAVFCASPGGGYKPPGVMPSPLPRTYLVAGTQEPFFLANAGRWADGLRDAGADVVMNERAGSHGGAFWREEFPLMVAWAFGR
jgi:predicted esterase